ncbi:MAG: hypothetical protein K1W38_05525, partial [Lachnospiraceae bacterium]
MEEYGNYISVALLPLLAILQPHRWKNFGIAIFDLPAFILCVHFAHLSYFSISPIQTVFNLIIAPDHGKRMI